MKKNVIEKFYNKFLKYTPPKQYNFFLTTENAKDIEKIPVSPAHDLEPTDFSKKLSDNLSFLKFKYNALINNSDALRKFKRAIFKFVDINYNKNIF